MIDLATVSTAALEAELGKRKCHGRAEKDVVSTALRDLVSDHERAIFTIELLIDEGGYELTPEQRKSSNDVAVTHAKGYLARQTALAATRKLLESDGGGQG